jgi:hypothetical protein
VTTQPEALRLAGVLEALNDSKKLAVSNAHGQTLGAEAYRIALSGFSAGDLLEAAAELRRQHEVIAELLEALKVAFDASWDGPMPYYARDKACAAIIKATEVKP